MTAKFLTPVTRGLCFALFLSMTFTLTNCSNDDDNPPEEYEFSEDFEDIGELPELDDPDPEISEPDLGGVKASAATESVITNLEEGGDLSAETQASLDAIDAFLTDFSAEVQAEASNLTAERIEEIINAASLDEDLASLTNDIPDNVAALLPTINYSDDFNRSFLANALAKSGIDLSDKIMMQDVGTGPCFDAAKEAYDDAMEEPIAKRDAQLATIETNYQTRLTAVNTRYDSRQANVDEALGTYKTNAMETAKSILAVANSLEDSEADLSNTLKKYALIYAVNAYKSVEEWYNAASELLIDVKADETAYIESIRNDKEAMVMNAFKTVEDKAKAALKTAYSQCHNQGTGS